ncbi:hypothetical protein [Nocardioides yefusunii]|uniref:Uncharacterized protein n=1 Tax=Nocardioides yefusunii TaxID=2500546 RepID=A0ABW1R0C9_9ACTN|nr:hypothetical protein [Nocardioides yefusunii]
MQHTVHDTSRPDPRPRAVHRAVGAMAVLTLAFGLSACGSDDEKSAENKAEACGDAETLRSTIESARANLSSTSTVDEWRTAKEAIEKGVDRLEDSLEKTNEDAWKKVDDAWDDFTDALDDVPDDATVPEAGQTLVDEVQRLQDARASALSGLDCG